MIRNKIPTRRSWLNRMFNRAWYALEHSWIAVGALYAAIFAIVFAANYWS